MQILSLLALLGQKARLDSNPPWSRKRRKKRRSPRKIKNFEDDYENEEELERFKLTGIRTKTHTLELTR